MKTYNLRLHVLAALMASAAVFHVGCGDDDDQETPNNGTGGKASGTGGTSGKTGGTSGDTGGKVSTGGTGTTTGGTAGEGSGGEPTTGGTAGAGGMPEGGSAGQGGAGGGGGGTPDTGLPPCTSTDFSSTKQCYVDCDPNKTANSEQFLNRCSEAGANCTKFDNSTLTKLGANGALPPLP
jgi:hypothetical protein